MMESNTNKKMRCSFSSLSSQPRNVSMEDDDVSQYSIGSCNLMNVAVSDTESQSSVSVRDMVKRYDTAAKMNNELNASSRRHQLPRAKPSYSGVTKCSSQTNIRQNATHPVDYMDKWKSLNNQKANVNRTSSSSMNKDIDVDSSPQNRTRYSSFFGEDGNYRSDYTRRTTSTPIREMEIVDTNQCAIAQRDIGTDKVEAAYQSKTTIAKTSSGVRITIDIFFDKEHQPVSATDVIGSRVETDIPQSRILNEFQKRAAISELSKSED